MVAAPSPAPQPRPPFLDLWLLLYALNYAFWHIGIIFFTIDLYNRFLMADALDLLTPVVMIFLAMRLAIPLLPWSTPDLPRAARRALALGLLGAVLFVEGHGMHLSANAIARHLQDAQGQPVYQLTYFFDEHLGHLLWDGGSSFCQSALYFWLDRAKRRHFESTASFASLPHSYMDSPIFVMPSKARP